MDDKLKPCPFCGKAPEESERADKNTCTGRAYFVSCMCGGYSANANQFGETKEEVVSKWNRRAYAEQLERDRDALKQRLSPQPVGAVVAGKQTDLSKRLRAIMREYNDGEYIKMLMLQAAEEIERYYTGMCNWKASAEAKDAALAAQTAAPTREQREAEQRMRMNERFANRSHSPATDDFDLPMACAEDQTAAPQTVGGVVIGRVVENPDDHGLIVEWDSAWPPSGTVIFAASRPAPVAKDRHAAGGDDADSVSSMTLAERIEIGRAALAKQGEVS